MDVMNGEKVYPTAEELSTITNLVECTETGCTSLFKSKSNLYMHLAKSHKKKDFADLLSKKEGLHKEYHCPEGSCIYNNSKYFKSLKMLKQHYLKVHSPCSYICETCGKGFSTFRSQKHHQEYCGINFACSECPATYNCYDSLTTHCRRKKHKLLAKNSYKQLVIPVHMTSVDEVKARKVLLLLPKSSSSPELDTVTTDKSSQTNLLDVNKKKINKLSNIVTQTSKNQYPQITAETQTIGDYFRKENLLTVPSSSAESLKKSMKTQTNSVALITKSCNTSFNLNELDINIAETSKISLGTQTFSALLDSLRSQNSNLEPTPDFSFINSSCQTTSFNENLDTFDSNNFFICDTETQTDFEFDFDLLNNDYYSNNCTQTCDDILVNDMVNDSHTQTIINELCSVGSQTTMSVNTGLISKDATHIETQTEIVNENYKEMLEEINA